MSCAQFKLDMFEGPLDLLLHLISKHKLNIHDIQISLLLEQYLEYIHGLDHEDLEDAADFLEMAARLIYIKTVSLLPHDEEAAELKKELEGRLIEYSQCKLLAGILAGRYVGADVFVRRPEPIPVDKTYTREHDAGILLDAYLGLSEKARNEKPINAKIFQPLVSHKVVSIGTKIVYILKRLYTCGVCDLSHIYDGMDSKSERVATFLAILELTKSGRIVLNDDNTQISFSERSLERKKHPKGEAAASDAEKTEQEQTAPKSDDDEEKEGGEQQEPAAAQTLQQIPEFKPDESVHMPPEPKSEQAEKPKTHIKQATERIAYNDPPVLAGQDTEHGYVLHIMGDWWVLDGLVCTNCQKGIVLDHSNHTVIQNCELYKLGAEAVAIRDGSSYCTVKDTYIHDTGLVSPGYGEGVYVGSAKSTTGFDYKCDHNRIIGCTFKNVAAEHIDVKEYTTDTEISGCTFYGDGMTGENYAGSFIDLKGNDCYVHDNVGYRNGNPKIVAAFEIHEQAEGWGLHHVFENNTVYMDQPYGAENTLRRMYVVDGWFSDFTVKNNKVDYGSGLVPANSREYYNSDYVTYAG